MKTYKTREKATAKVQEALDAHKLDKEFAQDWYVRLEGGRWLPVVLLRENDERASEKISLAHKGFRVEDVTWALKKLATMAFEENLNVGEGK